MIPKSPDRTPDFVQSLERGLAVIKSFNHSQPELTLSDVARETGLTRAAARRFLYTLQELGYIRNSGRLFSLTPRVLDLGYAYLSSLSFPEIALPHLESMVARVHESCSISVLDGTDIVYVARVASRRIMRVQISVGTRFPAHATSMGRVLLAAQPEEWLEEFLRSVKLEQLTDRTVTDPEALRGVIDRVRADGFAIVDQELEFGLRSIAVPVRDPAGTVIAAVNVSTHAAQRSTRDMRRELLPALRETARGIEQDLAAGG